ncbi:MAG: hypothetical protein DRJ42_01355 [Deltaproteobacteria bacterium]|nr:MAG: hypothetical protein DRJ42_01355 [Deltaproteobacteria bacterium]
MAAPETEDSETVPRPAMEKPEPAVVAYWRISGIVSALILFGMIAFQGLFFLWADNPEVGLGIVGVAGVLGALRITWVLVTTRLRYRRLEFTIDAVNLRVRHGVLVHREKTIPITRLQHLDVDRGPLERLFGLASLSVFTSGGRAATFRIPGLTPTRAEEMRGQVLAIADDAR